MPSKKEKQYRRTIVVQGLGNGFTIDSDQKDMTVSEIKAEVLAQITQVLDEALANPNSNYPKPAISEDIQTEWDEQQQKYVSKPENTWQDRRFY